MTRAYLYKLIRSPLLYIGIAGVLLMSATHLIPSETNGGSDVCSEIDFLLEFDALKKVIAIFGALPFTANFADEWNNSVTTSCIVRRGVRRYAFANVLFCALTTLFTVFIGMSLFTGGYSLFYPYYEPDGNPLPPVYGFFLKTKVPAMYTLTRIFVYGASCAMWSVMGLALSAFFPNKYIAISAPFVASYVVERIAMKLPELFNLWHISLSYPIPNDNPLIVFIYAIGLFALIITAFGFIFAAVVKRRVQNEIT